MRIGVPGETLWTQRRVLAVIAFASILYVLARSSWVSEDAYIGFRIAENFVAGRGLVFNVGERVQAFTCPLWVLLLSASFAVTREAFFTASGLSLLLAAGTVAVVLRSARGTTSLAAPALLLLLSKSFVDFQSSGMEGPLNAALLAGSLASALAEEETGVGRFAWLSAACAGLALVTRMEDVLLVGPVQLTLIARRPPKNRVPLAVAFLGPIAAWMAFSLIYFGFPFPNTAYAKLGAGIPGQELARQGLRYLSDSLRVDPITLASALAVCAVAVRSKGTRRAAVIGLALYVGYVVRAGGDFMSGRFLAPVVPVTALLLGRILEPLGRTASAAVILTIASLGFAGERPTVLSFGDYVEGRPVPEESLVHGIADERSAYGAACLDTMIESRGQLRHVWADQGRRSRAEGLPFAVKGNIGFFGYFAGPSTYVFDPGALADPLLAHLPAVARPDWRIGHFTRAIPDGYVESLLSGKNSLKDSALAAYYDEIRQLTRGPLWSAERWGAIIRINLGWVEPTLDRARYSRPAWTQRQLSEVAPTRPAVFFTFPGLEVDLGAVRPGPRMNVALVNTDHYRITFLREGLPLGEVVVGPTSAPETVGFATYDVAIPPAATSAGSIRFTAVPGKDGRANGIGFLVL